MSELAPAPRAARSAQLLAVRTARGPLRRAWALAYEAAARAFAAWLAGGGDVTAYARGSLAAREPVAGLSDLDLVLVAADEDGRRAVERRHARLAERTPWLTQALLEAPRVHADGELARVAGETILTAPFAAYGLSTGAIRQLERPGLGDPMTEWRRLRGPERRPREPPARHRDGAAARADPLRPAAAWLEVQYRWQWGWRLFGGELPSLRSADVAAKLVLEPARAWVWLRDGAPPADRPALLAAAGEAEADVALALATEEAPWRSADLARLLPAAVRMAERVAAELAAPKGTASDDVALVRADGSGSLPLADWRATVRPEALDARLDPLPGDARDPSVLADAQRRSERGVYPCLRAGSLLLLAPGRWWHGTLRTIQCQATDPASFALLDGRDTARFPQVPGFSIGDRARRATAEHDPGSPHGARARDLLASVEAGAPVLPC